MAKYDLGFIFCGYKRETLLKWLRQECRYRNLKFVWINEQNAEQILKKLHSGQIKISFLVDNESNYYNPEDLYMKICYAVKDFGGKVIDDPDNARSSADKSVTHFDFEEASLPVPYTVVVRNWQPDDFTLTREQIKKLGQPFIIKPAKGFGQKGVIKDASGDITQIAEARHFSRGDNFLLQEKIVPAVMGDKLAWFRVYYLFGEIIPCFWHPETGHYHHINLREMYNFRLLPLARYISEIGRIVSMNFFSTEIALTGKGKNTWVCEDGQDILSEAFDIPELVPKYFKGKVMHDAPNPHYVYAYVQEIGKKVPVVISKHFKDRLVGKQIDIEAIQDNKGVSYRHAPKAIR